MRYSRAFRILLVYILQLFLMVNMSSQNLSNTYLDSLGYEELLTKFNKYSGDSINLESIARTYLRKARKEGDTIKMARGYDRLARIFKPKVNLIFADSVISLTMKHNHITYPAMGYILKGYNYRLIKDAVNASKNYKKADSIAQIRKNLQQQVHIMQNLISEKITWGNKEDALSLQHSRDRIIKSKTYFNNIKKSTRVNAHIDIKQLYINELLNSNINYIFCHLNLRNYDSTRLYIDKTKELLKEYNWVEKNHYENWIDEVLMELFYYESDYNNSIIQAKKLLDKESRLEPHSRMNVNLFKGLSLIRTGQRKLGITYLKKSDSTVIANEIQLLPNDRKLLVVLKEYYRSIGDAENHISYLNRIVEVDSAMMINYKYFEPNMIRNFETPQLLLEKETLISSLKYRNRKSKILNWGFIFLLLISLLLLVYYIQRQQLYKRRFDKLMQQNETSNYNSSNQYAYELSPEVINNILLKMEGFERSKTFLNHEITLQSLAKLFETNANYLSRVINAKIGKNFSQYINDLRIDYAMTGIRSDKKLRKYTIKAIAEECGYKNAESFSKAFYKRNGIYPSYYIKKLNKADQKN
ncbi:MAG: AraC family transcriptional regulator [Flavobacteriaceae bacterium]|nr:AraC family transcriptional regulator [Flavobacteriaceae bacterium]NNJ82719.1 AraC family transcriptional regulator [Flavobacteriaceae bacterium]